jgi:hypothetical protein
VPYRSSPPSKSEDVRFGSQADIRHHDFDVRFVSIPEVSVGVAVSQMSPEVGIEPARLVPCAATQDEIRRDDKIIC